MSTIRTIAAEYIASGPFPFDFMAYVPADADLDAEVSESIEALYRAVLGQFCTYIGRQAGCF